MDLIVANGTVVTAADVYRADVGVRGGRIVAISEELTPGPSTRVLDASGRYVFPGGVDSHTHLDMPFGGTITADDFRTGTIAAACGGTTSIVDFCIPAKGQRLADALKVWHEKAAGKAAIDYGFHSVIVEMPDAVYDELPTLPDHGVTSLKLFMAYKGTLMSDDWTLVRALARGKAHGALVMVHAENGDAVFFLQRHLLAEGKTAPKYHATSRPPRVEAEATARAIALAETLGAPLYVVHVTCAEALEEIERARARGVAVLAETCTQYLYFTESDLDRPNFEGAKFVFTPPLRGPHQHELLWRALANGSLQAVTSDHCSFNLKGQKELGRDDFTKIPNGGPGIEERLTMVYQGVNERRITLNRFVELVSTGPARIFGLYPRKGTIAVGGDADLVVWNPEAEATITNASLHHNVDYTLYEGKQVRGLPETVTLRGQVIVDRRRYVGTPGTGQFLPRARFGG
ncbi:MAG TPA: dihydropyrimidinase [Chloroflexota bacterium]|nr:dihydropyrimidinase [Chloroflexota bacterium]